jgi:hypothetical protein
MSLNANERVNVLSKHDIKFLGQERNHLPPFEPSCLELGLPNRTFETYFPALSISIPTYLFLLLLLFNFIFGRTCHQSSDSLH